jgi:hypothetical protein
MMQKGRIQLQLCARAHDSYIIYIGKAQYSNPVFREAKNRDNNWISCLKEKRVMSETMPNLAPYVRKEAWSSAEDGSKVSVHVALPREDVKYKNSRRTPISGRRG